MAESRPVSEARRTGSSHGRPTLATPGVLLGVGLGGFIDGILLHQVLQWHHLLTSTSQHPSTTVSGLEANTLADGLFHLVTYLFVIAGVYLIWRDGRAGRSATAPRLAGSMLVGWGAFNLVEGVVDHQVLAIHHVNPQSSVVAWDLAFLLFGAALVATGLAVARRQARPTDA